MAIKRKKIIWGIGDVFAVPLNDGKYSIGHILSNRMKNVIGVALYDERVETLGDIHLATLCNYKKLISLVQTTRELVDNDTWKILGNKNTDIPKNEYPNEKFRDKNWVGSITQGAGIVWDFLNAFYALAPWDIYFDPDYFTDLLYDVSKKPKNLIFTKDGNSEL